MAIIDTIEFLLIKFLLHYIMELRLHNLTAGSFVNKYIRVIVSS